MSRSDTLIPTPDTTLRKLVIAAEQSNILKVQIEIMEGREVLFNKLIAEMDSKYALMEDFYKKQMANQQQQLNLYADQIKGYEALVKKERRLRRAATFAGIATTAGAIYLFITK